MTPEGKVQNDVKHYLKQNRIYNWRFQAQSNLNGIPDILCLYKGFFIGLELKREKGGHATQLQLKKLKIFTTPMSVLTVSNSTRYS